MPDDKKKSVVYDGVCVRAAACVPEIVSGKTLQIRVAIFEQDNRMHQTYTNAVKEERNAT